MDYTAVEHSNGSCITSYNKGKHKQENKKTAQYSLASTALILRHFLKHNSVVAKAD
jgi:hypothetical protein